MKKILYHGSKVGGIKVLEPKIYKGFSEKSVVFATDDRLYAIAMIEASGNELAVMYAINPETKNREMYIDELKPDMFNALNNPGYLYEVNGKDFEYSPEGLDGEYVSYQSAPVIKEIKIENIRKELEKASVNFVNYDDVLESMAKREKAQPTKEHAPDRFIK